MGTKRLNGRLNLVNLGEVQLCHCIQGIQGIDHCSVPHTSGGLRSSLLRLLNASLHPLHAPTTQIRLQFSAGHIVGRRKSNCSQQQYRIALCLGVDNQQCARIDL